MRRGVRVFAARKVWSKSAHARPKRAQQGVLMALQEPREKAEVRSVAAAALGAGPADPARCSIMAVEAMSQVAGAGFAMTSLSLDVASHRLGGGEISIRAQADKRTRSIVFASAEAWQGDRLVFSAQGLFSQDKAQA